MKKNKISHYILFIACFSLFTILVFIIQQSYNRLIEPTKKVDTMPLLKPIDPKLDLDVFKVIESKIYYQ